jgi:hypothetical protein
MVIEAIAVLDMKPPQKSPQVIQESLAQPLRNEAAIEK